MRQYITTDKIFYHPEETIKINQHNQHQINPITIELHLSNKCNNKCIYCGMEKIKDKKIMSYQEIIHAINFIKEIGGRAICYTGGGEPTLNPFFYDALRYAHTQELESGIITNGINISDYKALLEYSKWIRISIDAADKKTYFNIRKSYSFETVVHNLRKLLQYNKEYNKIIGIQFIVNQYNLKNLTEHVLYFVDHFPILNYINVRPIESLINNPPYHHYELKTIISQLSNLKEIKKVIISDKWELFKNDIIKNKTKNNFNFSVCHAAHYLGVINAYGDFYLCCHMLSDQKYKYGNVFKMNPKDFFLQRQNALQPLGKSQGFNPEICPYGCRGTAINTSIEKMINEPHRNFI